MGKIAKEAVMCFVIKDEKVLMINRSKSPFMGLWNAVGGKVEENESPIKACIREVKEESGIDIKNPKLLSTFTWNYDKQISYAFVVNLSKSFDIKKYDYKTSEGVVAFKDFDWILDKRNYGVIEDLRIFISDIKEKRKRDYHLVYKGSHLKKVKIKK